MPAKLKIDIATYEAAKYACTYWHYSKAMPAGKLCKYGVRENDKFIGVIIFGYGANNNACKYFNLKQTEVCELVRVALCRHDNPVSKILSISLNKLKKDNPGIKLVFSYADKTNQNHNGIIYQASNFKYLGERTTSNKGAYYIINGKKMHGRSARARYGNEHNFPKGWKHCESETKLLYVYVLDQNYKLDHPVLMFPKRGASIDNDASSFHEEEDGVTPIAPLQNK